MPSNPRIRKPGTCGACRTRWADDDRVVLTRSGDIACEEHRGMFIPEAIVAAGPYREIRTRTNRGDAP